MPRAIPDITVEDGEAVATFRDPLEPWDLVLGNRMVNCRLFDPNAVETPRVRDLVSRTPAGSQVAEVGGG